MLLLLALLSTFSPFDAKPPAPITRADLAAAYLRFEQALRAHPPAVESLREHNQAFDRATLAFFAGDQAAAIRTINALTAAVTPTEESDAQRLAAALKVRLEPPVRPAGAGVAVRARITSLYLPETPAQRPQAEPADHAASAPARSGAPDAQRDLALELIVRSPDGAAVARSAAAVRIGSAQHADTSIELIAAEQTLTPGTYVVELGGPGTAPIIAARLNVAAESYDALRERNAAALAAIAADTPALRQALAACRARNRLLTDRPSESNSAQFLADLHALSAQVADEITALAARQNPYRQRVGDYWRVVVGAPAEIPCRIYAPAAARGDAPRPLLVALHGAGGDENMFMDGYGAGCIKQVADELGLIVASPATMQMNPASFDALVEALVDDYVIDRRRVYVLGHSLGAGVAATLARSRAERIAAACLMAGGPGFNGASKIAPTLVIAGEIDPLAGAARVRAACEAAAAAGLPVEFRAVRDQGHTLLVGATLRSAAEWMLKHESAAP